MCLGAAAGGTVARGGGTSAEVGSTAAEAVREAGGNDSDAQAVAGKLAAATEVSLDREPHSNPKPKPKPSYHADSDI